jgi:hypothetical protein
VGDTRGDMMPRHTDNQRMINEAEVRESIRLEVTMGEGDFADVVRASAERWEDEVSIAEITQIADREFARHVGEQKTWPAITDCDRLTAAFRDLGVAGITARENFTCCQNCGVSEIGAEGKGRGYVFYHRQDMKNAAEGGGLYLAYGPDASIGREITDTLCRHDLGVEWDGDAKTRIHVPLTWWRRRLGRLAVHPHHRDVDGAAESYRLDVIYAGRKGDESVLMTVEECCDLLMRMAPRDGNFVSCKAESGAVVQVIWEEGMRLWAESPDMAARCSRGRHVTLGEAKNMITILAREGRVALDRLGPLKTVSWSV